MGNKILVVDDEKVILELTSMILKAKGFDVLTAENGHRGLELIEEERPDLVLLDYMMPGMDGMTALREVRLRFPDVYVIMFTGKGSEEIAVGLMKAGASDYILKPFNNQDLLDRIDNVLRLRRIEIHNRELREERERLLREIEDWNRELEARVEQKSVELEQAHAEILQTEKLAALGHLAAGMAHEIRNPLNSINLFAQILKSDFSADDDNLSYIEKIFNEVERIDDILVKLLNASKRPHFEPESLVVTDVIDRVLDSFSVQVEAQGIEVVKDYAPTQQTIRADPEEIEQIFSNLFSNSIYEMPDGGQLKISLAHDESGVDVVVSDSGGGIPTENLKTIFDPFFTTKEKGTGFGLSVVLRIVKAYGGKITVDSALGEGTTFNIRMPLAQGD
ncbi:MAG: response regulator [Desulfuromonadales bacterium]|nr:response regulator [Desulfuromonadales bacterium]NIR33473.1 response regulator [Desulfuromonadales bacterium]NIS43511.1 response regulator [Desulfuromonadales bacterium]